VLPVSEPSAGGPLDLPLRGGLVLGPTAASSRRSATAARPGAERNSGANLTKEAAPGWGNISDAATRLGSAQHAQPGSILPHCLGQQYVTRARCARDPASCRNRFAFRAIGLRLMELCEQKDEACEGRSGPGQARRPPRPTYSVNHPDTRMAATRLAHR
jgi:hypothetical protein